MSERRTKAFAVSCLATPLLVVLVLSLDARSRRATNRDERASLQTLAPRLPTSDLALSGGARWLRAPSLEEPSAAFADGPALPDPDPAGGAMAPPIEVWAAIAERSRPSEPRAKAR